MKHARLITSLVALLFAMVTYAQDALYTGTVVDNTGEPIIGASVVEKGSSRGSVTDLDGKFSFKGQPGATLVISYVGYTTQEVKGGQNLNVKLLEDQKTLQDVVVIGYGVQKKSVVTAAIAKVDASDLENTAPVRVDNALKGLAAGVNVTSSSGQPGAAARIRVRGTGTINNSDPLYIIDGIPYEGSSGIDALNPSDIESIEVLKDAASGAIYGARAANGVILVTTKQGKAGKAQVNYNFSYGWQTKWRKREVTGATDYAILQNEQYVNSGQAPLYADPYNLVDINGNPVTGRGTDWQDLVFNDNAPVMNHEVSINGGNDAARYYLSMGYYTQDGIVGGNYDKSNYQRLTLRSNTNATVFDATKERNFLNKLNVSVNINYARIKSVGITENSAWGSVLGSALALSPVLPEFVTGQRAIDQHNMYSYIDYSQDEHGVSKHYDDVTDKNGNVFTIPGTAYNEMYNPVMVLNEPSAWGWSHHFTANFAAELGVIDNLKYRFAYSADMSFWGTNGSTPQTWYNTSMNTAQRTGAWSDDQRNTTWQVENTLTYDKTFGDHHFNIVLGQSCLSYGGYQVGGNRDFLINPGKPSINYATGKVRTTYNPDGSIAGGAADFGVYGGPFDPYKMASYFGRASYDYQERYMAQFTVRRDGSSRFGPNNKFGTFPSFSLGWNLANEPYLKMPKWLNTLKLRFSWGKNGNDNIGNFQYTVNVSQGNNYFFGNPAQIALGSKASGLANPDLKWEESKQTDIGVDFAFFNSALTLTVDYFNKRTDGMLMTMNIPEYVGEARPIGNVGDMRNRGVEFELGYKWRVADANFSVKGNASYLSNELLRYGNETGYADYDQFRTAGTITRAENGKPFPFFYGYKTAGIFQTVADVQNYKNADGSLIQPDAKPGDVRFVDVNGDGKITDDDKTDIGNGTPKWTFGLNFNASWRGLDFNMFWQGVAGVKIFDATHPLDISSANYPTWMLQRWTGPGTSNRIPRLSNNASYNWLSSDLYVNDGKYLRLKNITLGYTLPSSLTNKILIQKLRVYVSAENLLTFTKYHGYDPEISSGGTSLGVDYGNYPMARTWTIGFNLTL